MSQGAAEFAERLPTASRPPAGWQLLCLLGLVALCIGGGVLGAVITADSVRNWYPTLDKPSWTPPSWLFGPAWTVLYGMMAVAAWLVWRDAGWPAARGALALFGVQLALNFAWSPLFFGLRNPGLAFAEILVLWVAIAATLIGFWRHSSVAALLMAPYLAWTTFAALLNFAIWRMNG